VAFYSGRTGALFLIPDSNTYTTQPDFGTGANDVNRVFKIRDWSLETSMELLETTTIDTAVKSYTPGVVSSTGSATVLYYREESGAAGRRFDELLSKVMKTSSAGVTASDRVVLGLRVGNTPGAGNDIKDDISFMAFITSASLQVSTGELTSISINFTIDGQFLEIPDA
jgi:hypothetical protein